MRGEWRMVMPALAMLSDLMKAFGQISEPVSRRLLRQALGLSLLTFALLWALATLLLSWLGGDLLAWAQARGWDGFGWRPSNGSMPLLQ